MIKVIELFSGIGSQTQALKNQNIEHKIVGISEWSINSIISYGEIHTSNNINIFNRDEILEELKNFTFSLDTKIPFDISKLNDDRLFLLYKNHKNSKNLGSIVDIKGFNIPDSDLITYSFPCTDISLAGNNEGLFNGKASSLLWEVGRILDELNDDERLPELLLMENVKALTFKSNKKGYNLWKEKLTEFGYYNYQVILNSKDFGIPQIRERVFLISSKNKLDITIQKQLLTKNIGDFTVDIEDYNGAFSVVNKTVFKSTDLTYVKNTAKYKSDSKTYLPESLAPTLRTNGTVYIYINEQIKKLGWKSYWKLMGFDDDIIHKVSSVNNRTELKKQAGNSIVVNVLEEIFRKLFK